MKKALFVTYHNLSDAFTGGTQCSFRNFRMVSNFYETDIYFVDNSRWNKLLSFFRLFFPPITIKDKRKITSLIKNNEYECIFFDSSLFLCSGPLDICLCSVIVELLEISLNFTATASSRPTPGWLGAQLSVAIHLRRL